MNQLSNPIGPGRVYTHHRSPWGQYTVVSIPGEGASADSGRLTRVSSGANSPFQKQIRLHEARARLLAEPGDVAGVGFAVGYDNPSQFSREYRRTFGVSPSGDTLVGRTTIARRGARTGREAAAGETEVVVPVPWGQLPPLKCGRR